MSCCRVLTNSARIFADNCSGVAGACGSGGRVAPMACADWFALQCLSNCVRKVCRFSGLTSQAFMPTAAQRSPSSRRALAVTPIMGT
ncbi:hypothetical protein D9M71_675000 [compost metagenome]